MRIFYAIILLSFAFSIDAVTIGNQVFSDTDFFSKYGRSEWENSDEKQKDRMLKDYIKREACAIEAKSLGFMNDPNIAVKLRDRSNMVMVNSVYEELVARPLISEETLSKTRLHIKVEIDLSHILVGFEKSRLQKPPKRTKDEAFLLAQNIKTKLINGQDFSALAKKYSDDPSAPNNGGSLGWIGWGRTDGAFQEATFRLKVGEVSDPILTNYGYHVVIIIAKRPSEHSNLTGEALASVVYNASRGTVSPFLKKAAAEFDSLNLSNASVRYNDYAIAKIVALIDKEKERKRVAGQYKVDLVSLFESSGNIGVVCVYNNRGIGIKWFAQKLRSSPSSRHPNLDSVDNVMAAFNIIILQDIALTLGQKENINNKAVYKNKVDAMENSLLYDTYLKWLVNSAPLPDSLQVKAYYNENKNKKYKDPIKALVREIKVLDRALADSLLLEIQFGFDFEEAAVLFSKTSPSRGGLMSPFAEGKYNNLGEIAFSLQAGEISSVIENLDRSYSIIRLEKMLPEQYSKLNNVYSRIESVLTRLSQNDAKSNGVEGLFKKHQIVINKGFFNGETVEAD